jgi:RNA recognition motif-containing protein
MNIYIGSLSTSTNSEDLKEAFEAYGEVDDVKIIMDRYTGESRGFAFVRMSVKSEALAAIDGLNGSELKGRTIVVNEARPRSDKRGGGRQKRSW